MPYRLIKGNFYVFYPDLPKQGPEPDGDTIKFQPDNPQLVELLTRDGSSPAFNKKNMISLRFEAIDALELHFEDTYQNLKWAKSARDILLSKCNFGNISYYQQPELSNKIEKVEHNPVRGYILSNSLDTYGRIISFVFPGETNIPDGLNYFLKNTDVQNSLNTQLLQEGQVYPTFYTSMPADIKEFLRKISKSTRESRKGLWSEEDINTILSKSVPDLNAAEKLVMWPKLFRRLASYFNAGNTGLSKFEGWLRADPVQRDDSLQLPDGSLGNMHDLIAIKGDSIHLNYNPEDLVILPDNAPGIPAKKILKGDIRIIAALVNPIHEDKGNEYITVANTTPVYLSIKKWKLADKHAGAQLLDMELQPGEFKKIQLQSSVQLGNDGGAISLISSDNVLIDEAVYSKEQGNKAGYLIVF